MINRMPMRRMKSIWVGLLAVLCAWGGQAGSLTLQQGGGGYSGCTDTYIGAGGSGSDDMDENFGECDTLNINIEHYNPS